MGDRQLEVAPGERESARGWGAGERLELTDSSEPAKYPLTILHKWPATGSRKSGPGWTARSSAHAERPPHLV
jgi:hypothetical protein